MKEKKQFENATNFGERKGNQEKNQEQKEEFNTSGKLEMKSWNE